MYNYACISENSIIIFIYQLEIYQVRSYEWEQENLFLLLSDYEELDCNVAMIESEDDHGYYWYNAAALDKIIDELQFLGGRVKSLTDLVKSSFGFRILIVNSQKKLCKIKLGYYHFLAQYYQHFKRDSHFETTLLPVMARLTYACSKNRGRQILVCIEVC